jgi:limonene-1,2-epoxide hydrolase
MNPIQVAETFFAHWNANRIDEALSMLADDVLYDNVPFPDIVGRGEVAKFHRGFGVGTEFLLDWRITHIAAAVEFLDGPNAGFITGATLYVKAVHSA